MALRTGIANAQGDALLTLDADLTFHPGEAQKLIAAYRDGVDCVAGSPLLGEMEHVPLVRRFLSHGVNFLYRLVFGRRLTAASSVFRLYRVSRLRHLKLMSESFDINAEIVFKLIQEGAQIVEVPATLLVRTGGVSKISTWREIKNHVRLLWRALLWRLGFSS
jgi:glycosyltransferase involved in cell wall biosynthesis